MFHRQKFHYCRAIETPNPLEIPGLEPKNKETEKSHLTAVTQFNFSIAYLSFPGMLLFPTA